MKKAFLFTVALFLASSIYAQDIFKKHGFEKETLTLSKGRYEEVFTNKEVVQIGSVLLNTKTNKVVKFLDEETEDISFKSEYSSRWLSPDPLAEKYPQLSPYVFCANNPLKFVDKDGRILHLADNYAGAMKNIAQIAATTKGGQVMDRVIGLNDKYTLNSTFWTGSSKYDPSSGDINYVADPWRSEIDGGVINSMLVMGHETFHAYDDSYGNFFRNDPTFTESRAVSFGNYLRSEYSLSPMRESYGLIKDANFHQFGSDEKISNFTTLGNNADKTSYGFSYTKTTTTVESYKNIAGIRIPDKTTTSSSTYYMVVSRDKDNNATYKIYNNEDEYKKATQGW